MGILKIMGVSALLAGSAFAIDNSENRCSELGPSETVNLKFAYVEETYWVGDTSMVHSSSDTLKFNRYESLNSVAPVYKDFKYKIPMSIETGCFVNKSKTYGYAMWNGKSWDTSEDGFYATTILDIHGNKTTEFDSTNAYNLLLIRANNQSLDAESFEPSELFVSKTYEFAFESWFAVARAQTVSSVVKQEDGKDVTYTTVSSKYAESMAQDSLKAVQSARKALTIPEGVSEITVQVFHSVMTDPSRVSSSSTAEESSSSASEESSSSSEVSSSSENVAESSSSENVVESSGSEGTDNLQRSRLEMDFTTIFGVREIRRLDGSVVKFNEVLTPGVYYVQGMNGLWKKCLVKNR